jgi:hypothetical protein
MEEESNIERHAATTPDTEVEVMAGRRTIVTALPLEPAARQRLARLLDARVLDIRETCPDPDMVLTPSSSPQLIGALKRKYPGAHIVVVELDDWDFDIELGGPVTRLLRAGADAYLLADSIEELAHKIGSGTPLPDDAAPPTVAELTDGATVDELIAAFLRESVEYATRAHAEQAAAQQQK